MKIMIWRKMMGLALASVLFSSCSDGPDTTLKPYDRVALVANYTDNLIIPGYNRLLVSLDSLASHVELFFQNGDLPGLLECRERLKASRLQWLAVSGFEFGPGASNALRLSVNTFPVDVNQINLNVGSGAWDLMLPANMDAKGFAALEYLLHYDEDSAVVASFVNSPLAANRRAYFRALVQDLDQLISSTLSGWNTFAAGFKGNTGTDAGSSTSAILNQFTYDIEILKNARIGIPLGKTTFGQPVLANVESRFGGYSVELALAHARGLKQVFLGNSPEGMNGYGMDDALLAVDAQYNGLPLANAIENQFDAVISALEAVPDPLETAITTQVSLVDAVYVEIQKLVVLTKTDMASNLGILITYTDSDGD